MSLSRSKYIDESIMFLFSVSAIAGDCDPAWVNYVDRNRTPYWISDSTNLNGYVGALQQLVVFGYIRQIPFKLWISIPMDVVSLISLFVVEYGAIEPNPSGNIPYWLRPWGVDKRSSLRWRTHQRNAVDYFIGSKWENTDDNYKGGRLGKMTEWHDGDVWGEQYILEDGPLEEDKEHLWVEEDEGPLEEDKDDLCEEEEAEEMDID